MSDTRANFTTKFSDLQIHTQSLIEYPNTMEHNLQTKNKTLKINSLVFFLVFLIRFSGIHSNLFVILLKSCKILTCLGEFTLFHTFTNIPVNECTLRIHKIELVIDTGKSLSDCSVISNHTASTFCLCDITVWYFTWWLGVDTGLESSRTPVNELNGTLILDGSHGGLHIRWSYITTVHQTTRHELSVGRITLGKKRGWFGHYRGSEFCNRGGFMVCLCTRHEWCVCRNQHVQTWVWNQNGWEVVDINIQGTIES